ncbi:MAG: NYN domain-containing protein [Pirellulales bacterium]|nr:NYN domain-containing protein [Pirellulales bacterium]
MAILVDGYNVLYSVGLLSHGVGPGTLDRARTALLNLIASSLTPDEAARTTVVFDAAGAPRDAPRKLRHRAITVEFAVGREDADSLLEELIRLDSAPRRLTVVSGDHRIQRAARRRRAKAVDSETWWEELARRRSKRKSSPSRTSAKPAGPLSEEELDYWLDQFGTAPTVPSKPTPPPGAWKPPSAGPVSLPPAPDRPVELEAADSPFPPGYAEDLLQEDDLEDAHPPLRSRPQAK